MNEGQHTSLGGYYKAKKILIVIKKVEFDLSSTAEQRQLPKKNGMMVPDPNLAMHGRGSPLSDSRQRPSLL